MTVAIPSVVEELQRDSLLGPQVADTIYLPPVEAAFGEVDPPLPAALTRALVKRGVERPWSHQAEGLNALRRGENVLVTTPTASGKSLVFQLPVLEEALAGGPGRALFLFPLKALGQDQKAKLDALAAACGVAEEAAAGIYDGDTPRSERERIKRRFPRVIVTNPDMLHLGILGHWSTWAPFLSDLRWIVLDELHTYRGIFGSHFHHVLARLLRLCKGQGADPRLVASSATAANAGEFAEALTGRPFHWIAESGAPREGRHFVLLRPEGSTYTTALRVFTRLLEAGLKTIVFTKARRITELLYSWLQQQSPELADRVANYRSGFLAGERRKIEADLFTGRLDGVISTSALEMGIDVGGLDACVLVGYPGSVMATWQRSGRVGRSGRESVTVLVALPDALDQYFLSHPKELVSRSCERLVVDPLNEPVSRQHLTCAAAERPLHRERDRSYLEPRAACVGELLREGRLRQSEDGRELIARDAWPGRQVSLRGTGQSFTILQTGGGTVVGTVDGVRVLHECHPGAIYLHAGRQYLVRELDGDGSRVHAEPVTVEYFTTPLTEKETAILEVLEERQEGDLLRAWLGRLRVTERVVGFERRRVHDQELLGQHSLELPPVAFETVGLWWAAPAPVEETLEHTGEHFLGSLHAAEHAAISLFPLVALCDRGDIGGISIPLHPQLGCGCVFVYDGHPGGVGIARRGFIELPELLERVLALVEGCDCEEGCPSCIQSPKCGNGNRPLDKGGAARVLRLLLGREAPATEARGPLPRVEPLTPGEATRESSPAPPRRRPGAEPGEVGEAAVAPAPREPRREPPRICPPELRRTVLGPRDTVLFDLETVHSADEVGGWGNLHRLRVAVGVLLHLEAGRFEVFREEDVGELVARLEAADLVVGFNSHGFDYPVLAGYTGVDYRRVLPSLDLLEDLEARIGSRVGLETLARETLGEEKRGDGLESLRWVREGELERVEAYCRRDVELLRDLYLHGWRMGYLSLRDDDGELVEVAVEW